MANKYINWSHSDVHAPMPGQGVTDYPNTMLRGAAYPLDEFSLFTSLAEATTYASSNGLAYAGQIIAVSGAPGGAWVKTADSTALTATVDNGWTIFKTTAGSANVGSIHQTYDNVSNHEVSLTHQVDKTTALETPIPVKFTTTAVVTAYLVTAAGTLQELGSAGSVDQLRQEIQRVESTLTTKINTVLTSDVSCSDGEVISGVSQNQTTGKITVSKKTLTSDDLPNVPVTKLELGPNGEKIDQSLLPSYVDDVVELKVISDTPPASPEVGDKYFSPTAKKIYECTTADTWTGAIVTDPEKGKIYVTLNDNKTYRWSGTVMTEISASLTLGETENTAYRGDRGKTAYEHAVETKIAAAVTESKLYKITVTAQGHIGSATEISASDIPVAAYQFADGANGVGFTVTKPNGSTQNVHIDHDNATQSDDGFMSSADKLRLDGMATNATKVEASDNNGQIKVTSRNANTGNETTTDVTVYTHPTYTAADAAAKLVGRDSTGHVVLSDRGLTSQDVGTTITTSTDKVTFNATKQDGTTSSWDHPNGLTVVTAAAKLVGRDSKGHVVLSERDLTSEDVGTKITTADNVTTVTAKTTEGTNNTFTHPNGVAAATPAPKYVGYDTQKHVELGKTIYSEDVGTKITTADNTTTFTVKNTSGEEVTFTHPNGSGNVKAQGAYEVGSDAKGHVVIGDPLTPTKVGITVSATDGVKDTKTNVTYKYTHPDAPTGLEPSALKVAAGSNGHVQVGGAIYSENVGTKITTADNTTTFTVKDANGNSVTFTHPNGSGNVKAPAAVKVGVDSKGHVDIGEALEADDVGVVVTSTSVTDGKATFNKYVHPTYTAADPEPKKVGLDSTGHVILGTALAVADISGLQAALNAKEDTVGWDNNDYDKSTNKAATVKTVERAISALGTVFRFKGLWVKKASTDPDPATGGAVIAPDGVAVQGGDVYLWGNKEFVVIDNGASANPRYTWVELGDEQAYVLKTQKIAGIQYGGGDISKDQLLTALTCADGATKVTDGSANGHINVTSRNSSGVETTTDVTVYDDSALTAAVTSLASDKASKVVVNTSDTNAALLKVKVNSEGIVAGTNAVTKTDLDNVIGTATTSQNGLMTTTQVTKLNGIETGAQVNTIVGAKDANGSAFTVTDKYIMIDELILNGGSSTTTLS